MAQQIFWFLATVDVVLSIGFVLRLRTGAPGISTPLALPLWQILNVKTLGEHPQ